MSHDASPSRSAPARWRWRRAALILVALWIVGFEVFPVLHTAFHDAFGHHHHAGDAHDHGHDHGHGDEDEHGHWVPEVPDDPAQDGAGSEDDDGHGAHALAHHTLAAAPTPPPWPPVAEATVRRYAHAVALTQLVSSRAPQRLRARGPPVDVD
ncbi:MAG: hypothetical protein AAGA54_29360 [Myxococcota bacterium]